MYLLLRLSLLIAWCSLPEPGYSLSCFNCATKRNADCNVGLCEGIACYIDIAKHGTNGRSLKKGCIPSDAQQMPMPGESEGCFSKENHASSPSARSSSVAPAIRCVCNNEDFCNNRTDLHSLPTTIKVGFAKGAEPGHQHHQGQVSQAKSPKPVKPAETPSVSQVSLSVHDDMEPKADHAPSKAQNDEAHVSNRIHYYNHVTWKTSIVEFPGNKPNRFRVKLDPNQLNVLLARPFEIGLVDQFISIKDGWAYTCLLVSSNLVDVQLGPSVPLRILRVVDPEHPLFSPIYHNLVLADGATALVEIRECGGDLAEGVSNALLVLEFRASES